MTNLLTQLNPAQYQAVTAPLGNILILAGAGSGKTTVLINRMLWLIKQYHIAPNTILAVTFTNKAAGELKNRLQSLMDIPLPNAWIGTFHGLCHRMLRMHSTAANLAFQFNILDAADQIKIIKRVLKDLNLAEEKWSPKQVQAFININKDRGLRSQQIAQSADISTHTFCQIYAAYEQVCQINNAVDFAELLLRSYELLQNNNELLQHYRQLFHSILVDEFQDTNTIQYAWIRLIAGEDIPVMVVGDDDQSIYGWRGAQVENIHNFAQHFKNTHIIRLEQNYRSTANILNVANAVIKNNVSHMGKTLWTSAAIGEKIAIYSAYNELDEAQFVVKNVQQALAQGYLSNNIAILYRSNAQSRVIESALLQAKIPYHIQEGVRFFERAEIKDALAYLQLLINTDDDIALERIINFPTRGIGNKTLELLHKYAKEQSISLWQAANAISSSLLSARAMLALKKFIQLIKSMQQQIQNQHMELDAQVRYVIEKSGLHAYFAKIKTELMRSRLDNLYELVNAAKQFRDEYITTSIPRLVMFLAHTSLDAGETQFTENKSAVHLMTLHAAKGLEFDLVFLIGLEEGIFPTIHSRDKIESLEEERRLCYVGITRAKKKLILSHAEVRRHYGREQYQQLSRFIHEFPPDLLEKQRKQSKAFLAATVNNTIGSPKSICKIGQLVQHSQFGQGTIIAIEGSEARERVQVRFINNNVKWLILAYANLTILENA